MFTILRRLLADDSGATLVEYGLLLMLVALVCVGVLVGIGASINGMYSTAASEV
ncbi:MAG: Flp family type IVb pilin [Candidatus Tyrphobacter sp.]